MSQHIYLDANILLPLLWDCDPDMKYHCENVIETLRGQVRGNHDKHVKIPKLAIGEVVNRYMEDVFDGQINNYEMPPNDVFTHKLQQIIDDTNAELVSIKTGCWKIARDLRNDDRELHHNDLFIASAAILDSNSTHLLTTDSDLLETRSIELVASNRRNNDLSLTVSMNY